MATIYWIGGTSTNPTTAANWSGGALPADEETVVFNDQANQACGGGDLSLANPNEKEIAVIVEKSFPFTIGVSGTPFEINDYSLLHFAGSGIGTSYFDTGANDPGDYNDVMVDSNSALDEILNIDGIVKRWTQRSGKATLKSTATVSERIEVLGGGATPSDLTIPSGVTVTAPELVVDGGKLTLSAACAQLYLTSGEVVLADTANITSRLEQSGGTFFFDADSTLTLVEVRGGVFKTRKSRTSRIITTMRMYGDGDVDLSTNAGNITFTNGIQVYGERMPKVPRGTKLTFAFVAG